MDDSLLSATTTAEKIASAVAVDGSCDASMACVVRTGFDRHGTVGTRRQRRLARQAGDACFVEHGAPPGLHRRGEAVHQAGCEDLAVPRILFVGDVVGAAGRRTFRSLLPALREQHAIDIVVVNGENSAGGVGITPKTADDLFDAGADVITLGNHAYRHRDAWRYLDSHDRIIRPANYLRSQPGSGHCIVERAGIRLGVVNMSGNLFLRAGRPALLEIDSVLGALDGRVDHVLVDMHAEATSEKVAMGWHLDGRVTAVVGTHTHVPTADARILPKGTAYITDVGMTGGRAGVIGVRKEQSIEGMRTHMPVRYEPEEGDPWLMGVVITTADRPLRASAIEQVLVSADRFT